MKYLYKFTKDPLGDISIQLPKEISLFSDFIENITTKEQAEEYINIVKSVLDEINPDFEIQLNSTNIIIKKDTTTIENPFRIEEPTTNSIETEQFKELLLLWRDKIGNINIDKLM